MAMTVLPIASAETPGTPTDITAIALGTEEILVEWSEVTSAEMYYVYRGYSPDPDSLQLLGITMDIYFHDSSLNPDTTYYYVVVAYADEQAGEPSEYVWATTSFTVNNVEAHAISASEIFVWWDAVPNAQSYRIYRSFVADETYTLVATRSTPTFYDRGLVSDTFYYYKVQVGDEYTSHGLLSDYASAKTEPISLPPKPMNVDAETLSSTRIHVAWDAVIDADRYNLYRSLTENGPYSLVNSNIGNTEYTDEGLTPNTEYYYRVAGVNNSGEGSWSDFARAKTYVKPVANAEATSVSSIQVSWYEIPDATRYQIYRSDTAYGTYTSVGEVERGMTPLYLDTGLSPDTTYYYKVVAKYYSKTGEYSDPVSATTWTPPRLDLNADALSPSEIRLTWNAVSGADDYAVYRSTYNGGYTYIAQVVTTELIDTGLTPSTVYWYRVVASNDAEDTACAKTQDDVPYLTATEIDTQSIQLDWTSVTNADQYKVYRSLSRNGPYTEIKTVEYATTFTDMSLDHTTTYYYYVAAWDGYVEGNPSNIAFATTKTPVIGVPDVEAEALNTSSIKVTWNEITGAFDYNIYRSLTEDGTYEKIGDTEDLEFVDKDLDHTTTYYYKVAVYTGQDMGEKSAPASATTKTPEKPTNPGNGGSGEVKVTGKSTKTIAPGFETPVENEVVQVDEVQAGAAGFVFPFFLILAVLTTGVLYVRAKKRQNKIE
ncbi:fibronectin type III domain-containing protein [Methanimicrococcus blatticola]|nr:fibronectin type III domain-containing protein [Methanimicrococcus blatticola]